MKVQWLRRANLSKSQQSLTYSACTPAPASHFLTELRNLDVAHAFPWVNHWRLLVPPINISLVPPFPCLLFLLPSYSMVFPSPLALCIPCWPAPLPPGLPSTQLQGNLPTTHIWPFRKVPSGSCWLPAAVWALYRCPSDPEPWSSLTQLFLQPSCRSPVCWADVLQDHVLVPPELVKVAAGSPSQRDPHTIL